MSKTLRTSEKIKNFNQDIKQFNEEILRITRAVNVKKIARMVETVSLYFPEMESISVYRRPGTTAKRLVTFVDNVFDNEGNALGQKWNIGPNMAYYVRPLENCFSSEDDKNAFFNSTQLEVPAVILREFCIKNDVISRKLVEEYKLSLSK